MPTKHDHLKDEINDILSSVSGLTVVSSLTSGQEPTRPFVRQLSVGWKKGSEGGEKVTRTCEALVMLEVFIRHDGGVEGIEEERNRLDSLIEHAFDVHTIADYSDASYTCGEYITEYSGASPVLDQNQDTATFVATVQVRYIQTPIL